MSPFQFTIYPLTARVIFLVLLITCQSGNAFTLKSAFQSSTTHISPVYRACGKYYRVQRSPYSGGDRFVFLSLAASPLVAAAASSEATGRQKQVDRNGKEFIQGSVVRLVKPLKAYHVQKFGKISENKEFIPLPANEPPATRCLELPTGLRGLVAQVHDVNSHDASQPIVVKFTPGMYCDEEGFDTPVPFTMHFESDEVEVV
jgi:hypothetical protein